MSQLNTYNLESQLQIARSKAQILASLDETLRTKALEAMADNIESQCDDICSANLQDMQEAKKANLSPTMCARLKLSPHKVKAMADSIREIAALPSPLGKVLSHFERPNGLRIDKVSVPIGVIGVIYESRPNVTSDVSALCFKSGNVSILKGGKEALATNIAILNAIHSGLKSCNLPIELVTMIKDTSRDMVKEFVKMDSFVDLLIPRGGEGLINFVKQNATIPIIKHDKGVCHIYVEKSADKSMAQKIILNAKLSYPAACNACECVILDNALGEEFIADIILSLHKHNVRVMFESSALLASFGTQGDGLADFHKEYGDKTLNLKIVSGFDEALAHIAQYGSKHSESIITADSALGDKFLRVVDSACVYVNASTRFSDGGEFGFGAEVGISTSKLHARGPMGIDTLCSYKYCVHADGAVRE